MRVALIVDDEEGVCRALARLVARHGFEVVTSPTAELALELADKRERPFDLLITDVSLPYVDGFELARRFRAAYSETRVVLMSGYAADDLRRARRENISFAFLEKPFTQAELEASIATALADRAA